MSIQTSPLLSSATTALAIFALGCGDDGGDANSGADAGDPSAPDATVGEGCIREPRPENAARKLIVSRPYTDTADKADRWEVLDLSPTGEITSSDTYFDMARAADGEVVFTPDGEIGLVAQEEGGVGVFRIGEDGAVEVLHFAFKEDFYAESVVMSASGDRAYVLDSQWRTNGGGIYSLKIGCDDSIKSEGLVMASKLTRSLGQGHGDLW